MIGDAGDVQINLNQLGSLLAYTDPEVIKVPAGQVKLADPESELDPQPLGGTESSVPVRSPILAHRNVN